MKNLYLMIFVSLLYNSNWFDTIPIIDSNITVKINVLSSPNVMFHKKEDSIHNHFRQVENQETSPESREDVFLNQYQMPWIVALIIGISSVLTTIYINIRSEKFKNEIVNKQLNCTKDLTICQIEVAKQNALLEFKKSVLSVNRNSWLNEFRDLISKIITLVYTISNKNSINNDEVEKLQYLITKIELMLDPVRDQKFITALYAMHSCCIEILSSNRNIDDLNELVNNIKSLAISILKTKWNQVKNGV